MEDFKLSNRGFTIIEAMIAVGIMSIAAVGISRLIVDMNNQIARVEDRLMKVNMQQALTNNLISKKACENTLLSLTMGKEYQPLNAVLDSEKKPLVIKGSLFESLKVSNISVKAENPRPDMINTLSLVVFMESTKRPKSIIKPLEVKVATRLDGSLKVVECSSTQITMTDIQEMINQSMKEDMDPEKVQNLFKQIMSNFGGIKNK